MEEKKLTDEEIVKDIERSTGMPSYWEKIVLDLINRQKAEIERLTEEIEALNDVKHVDIINELSRENKELQKQVDELEDICLDCPYKLKFDEIEKQAVKDTAKEIWEIVMSDECSVENTFDDTKFTQIIKERYGVEVE